MRTWKWVMYGLFMGILLLSLACISQTARKSPPPPVEEQPEPKKEEKIELIKGAEKFELPTIRDPDEIHRTVSVRMGGIGYCYKKHIDQSGQTHGRLVIGFTITTNGMVKDITIVESDFEKQEFYDCIVERVARWRFDEIAKNGEEPNVQYPFEF